jgi:hypothetical protein
MVGMVFSNGSFHLIHLRLSVVFSFDDTIRTWFWLDTII